ncbi:hypothetical protein M0802_013812 [Mischocyttarus mexicanus]|nr:hypothetical protein M0802_013812 [Mischocyttarus mexicanus]
MAGEKRSQEQEDSTMLSQTTILVDIEGTTTSISFVKEVLFPYVTENLKRYITESWDSEKFKEDYNKLKEQAKNDEKNKVEGFVPITGSNVEEEQESLIKNILWQMDNDRKTGPLKQFQGHMWDEGYKTGIIKGRVYDDVPKSLELWVNNGKKVYVYSSGSVESQKLLFGHSEHGDLLKYFSGFFDTEVGAKQECNSYKNILSKLGEKPNNVIFLTDVVKEAAAAKEAGILPFIVIRDGNLALTDEETVTYTTIKSFSDLTFPTSSKRQKLNPTEGEEKDKSVNPNSSEPMDTSEDIENPDENSKEIAKPEITKSPQPEKETKAKTEETADQAKKDENEVMKDVKDATVRKPDDKEQSVTKQPETPTKVGGTNSTIDNTMTGTKNELVSKPETDGKKCTKTETVVQNETTTNVVKDNKTREECGSEKSAETETKVEGSSTIEKTNSSTTEANSGEGETTVKIVTQLSSKIENTSSSDATKTEDTVAKVNVEKVHTETEDKNNDTNKDVKDQERDVLMEKTKDDDVKENKEKNKEESKTKETKDNPEVKASLPKTEKHTESVESIEQESSKESVKESVKESAKESAKEETSSDEVKDKSSTVESEKKKLNGTTQNGDDVPVSDENLHSNGLNEGSSSEQQLTLTTSEEKPAQNGEPESSTDTTSAESIKVKKVVDSAVADGAGEPDVVPPVVVAATS